jgi:hypothetical protein
LYRTKQSNNKLLLQQVWEIKIFSFLQRINLLANQFAT